MNKLNFVSCVAWVPKGVAKKVPNRFKLSPEELKAQIVETNKKLKEMENNNQEAPTESTDVEMTESEREIVDRYNLGNYDDDEEKDFVGELDPDDVGDNIPDPYLDNQEHFSDEDEEKEDFQIKATDNLLLVGHVEDEYTSLEVKIYNDVDETYVHHEIYLQAYPICFEWLDFKKETDAKGNFVAIGDMGPKIGIWDLDTVDLIDPDILLEGHRDSVLDLAWNRQLRTQLASVSADKTCRLWDLSTAKELKKFDTGKPASIIQSAAFHPIETNVLLVGDDGGKASLIDCASGSAKKWNVCRDEIEKVAWNVSDPYTFFCATNTGSIVAMDCRNEQSQLYLVKAHDDMVSGMEFSSSVAGCLVTASDKSLKIWKVTPKGAEFVKELQPQVGKILSVAANPDLPFVFAVGGDNGAQNFKVIDISTSKDVAAVFGK